MNNNPFYLNVSATKFLVLSFMLSSALLAGALFFEHVMKMAPCQMCYWQRWAHMAVLMVSIVGLFILKITQSGKSGRAIIAIVGVAFLASFILAFWHMGVEYKWWLGPRSCSAQASSGGINPDDIFDALNGKSKLPLCSDAPWDLFGVSMAGYNALISVLASLAAFTYAMKGRGHVKATK